MRPYALVLLLVCLIPVSILAQPLADRVPEDAVIYVGWRGSKDLGPQYQESHLKAVIDASNLPAVFSDLLPRLTQRVAQDEPQAGEVMELVTAIAAPMWRNPSAIYFGGIDLSDRDKPKVRLALLTDAGDEAPALLEKLKSAAEMAQNPDFQLFVTSFNNLVVVSTFEHTEKPAASLMNKAEFNVVMARVQKEPVCAMYIDFERGMKIVDEIVIAMDEAEVAAMWPNIRDALGLNTLKRFAFTGAFNGKEWSEEAFLEAPAPRTGLLALMDGRPLSDDLLKSVPQSTTILLAGGLDLSRLLIEARAAVQKINPEAVQQFDQALAAGSAMVGTNIQNDLIASLGDQWALYTAPSVGGTGILGFTIVSPLKDAAKAERSLGMLETFVNNMIAAQMRGKDEPKIAMRQAKYQDMTVHYLAVPFVSPAWGIKDGNFYVALYPQTVASAAAVKDGPSILDNKAFAALRQRLEGGDAAGIQYMDLPHLAPQGYTTALALMQLGMGMSDMFGVEAPALVLPPMHVVMPHITPAASFSKADETGIHMRSISPFPGAEILGTQDQSFIGQQAMMISILLPSLNRARETANRVKCASNLRQIGQGMLLYANENRGQYPPDFAELLKTQDLTIDVFICPTATGDVPAELRAMPLDQQAQWVNNNANYVYLGAGKNFNNAGMEDVIAYEKFENHDGDGINMLYADGHVEFSMIPNAQRDIERSQPNAAPAGGL